MLDFQFKLSGTDEIAANAKRLSLKIQKELVLQSAAAATTPLVAAMAQEAPSESGALKRSIGLRLRRYMSGKLVFVAIGPRKGVWGPNGEKPSSYAHLVERGYFVAVGAIRRWISPNAFVRRAWMRMKDVVLANFRRDFSARLAAAAQSLPKRKTVK